MKPTTGTVTSPPITAPSPSVDASRNRLRSRRRLATLGLDRLGLAPVIHRRVARPEEAEDDRDRSPDRRDQRRVDDQPDEDARHTGRKPDRVERRPGEMR